MTGYNNKAEAMYVLKSTIRNGLGHYSTNPKNYYMNRLFDSLFQYEGTSGGWRMITDSEGDFMRAMHRHMRDSGRAIFDSNQREADRVMAQDLPWGDKRCRLEYGMSMERFNSM